MLQHILVASLGTVLVAVGWTLVQIAWRQQFAADQIDADALEGRSGCHGCAKGDSCRKSCDQRRESCV